MFTAPPGTPLLTVLLVLRKCLALISVFFAARIGIFAVQVSTDTDRRHEELRPQLGMDRLL